MYNWNLLPYAYSPSPPLSLSFFLVPLSPLSLALLLFSPPPHTLHRGFSFTWWKSCRCMKPCPFPSCPIPSTRWALFFPFSPLLSSWLHVALTTPLHSSIIPSPPVSFPNCKNVLGHSLFRLPTMKHATNKLTIQDDVAKSPLPFLHLLPPPLFLPPSFLLNPTFIPPPLSSSPSLLLYIYSHPFLLSSSSYPWFSLLLAPSITFTLHLLLTHLLFSPLHPLSLLSSHILHPDSPLLPYISFSPPFPHSLYPFLSRQVNHVAKYHVKFMLHLLTSFCPQQLWVGWPLN